MKSNVKVSIITPSYNQAEYLEETIKSVLNQTYTNIEYIIIDGGSTDHSHRIIEKYRSKFHAAIIEKDQGQSDAINKGFRLSTGDLVGWINSDDILYKNCIEKIVSLYELHQHASILYCPEIDFINKESIRFDSRKFVIPNKNHLIHKNSSVVQPGSFYNRKFLEMDRVVNEELHYCMDLDLWLRLLNHGPIVSCDGPVAAFRQYATNKTNTGNLKYSKERRKILFRNGATLFSKPVWYSYYRDLRHALNIPSGFRFKSKKLETEWAP